MTKDKLIVPATPSSVPCIHMQAIDLMRQWAPIDVADALELLSPDFRNPEVRQHAVEVLRAKGDEELLLYLLQLVQVGGWVDLDKGRGWDWVGRWMGLKKGVGGRG